MMCMCLSHDAHLTIIIAMIVYHYSSVIITNRACACHMMLT